MDTSTIIQPEPRLPLPPIIRYIDGSVLTMYNMDCIVGMKKHLECGQVDVVVTSPPYNLDIKYNSYHDRLHYDAYLDWTYEWMQVVRQVLRDDGSFFLNISGKPSAPWGPYDVLELAGSLFELQNVIHWVKSISIGDEPAKGHIKPINSQRFLNDGHEFIFHLTKSGEVPIDKLSIGVPYADESNLTRGNRGKNGNLRDRGNVWFMPYETINSRDKDRPHPATFPVELPLRCIKLHGLHKTEMVVDPFMGLGSTAKAAANLGVHFTGFEIDANYMEYASSQLMLGR